MHGSLRQLTAYIAARLREKRCRRSYEIYVTDALRCIAENTARAFGGTVPAARWADSLPGRMPDSGMDTARAVLRRAGIEVREYGSV